MKMKIITTSLATAERQHISYTDRALHWTPHLLYNYITDAKLVSTLSANRPCNIHTLSWIGHSRSSLLVTAEIQNGVWS